MDMISTIISEHINCGVFFKFSVFESLCPLSYCSPLVSLSVFRVRGSLKYPMPLAHFSEQKPKRLPNISMDTDGARQLWLHKGMSWLSLFF